MNKKISIIIPAFNEERFIGETLYSVNKAKESYQYPSAIEVIVVDNYSQDKTQEIALKFGANLVKEPKRCIAAVKNKGANFAHGEILVFLDSDTIIPGNILNCIAKAIFKDKFVGGGVRAKVNVFSVKMSLIYFLTILPHRLIHRVAPLGLMFLEKKVFFELGGFNESLYFGEDLDFFIRFRKYCSNRMRKIRIIRNPYVITSPSKFDTLGISFFLKYFLFKKGNIASDEKFRDIYCRIREINTKLAIKDEKQRKS